MNAIRHSEIDPISVNRPFLGYGLGLRHDYYETILSEKPDIDWFEVISENYMVDGGKPLYYLEKIRNDYPVVMHGVSLSIGGTDPLDKDYLRRLKALAAHTEPEWISDHLCWTVEGGHNVHDLMPLPYTEEAVSHVAARVRQVQDYLGRRILLENVSSYVNYRESQLTEWEFFSAVVEAADCLMLFDVNNVYVSAVNHGFDPLEYLDNVPPRRIQQFHLAGHKNYGDYIIDTHDHPIIDSVWDLYRQALSRFGPISTLIERDDHMPPLSDLMDELQQARAIGGQFGDRPYEATKHSSRL